MTAKSGILLLVCAAIALPACKRASPAAYSGSDCAPAADEFSVMTYNVQRWCLDDRDDDGQRDDPKPMVEKEAVIRVIANARPDILAVEEMGSRKEFTEFTAMLKKAGLEFADSEYLPSADGYVSLAVLSRFPIVSRQSITNENYSIGDKVLPVQRGFLSVDIQPAATYRFRLMAAHLKSKVFSANGQTEMRRNEARLLNKHVRHALDENPKLNLLVVGDLNDSMGSAAIREVIGRELLDLRPADSFGDIWSHFWAEAEEYSRIDYLLVSAGMKSEVVSNKTHVVRDRLTYAASDHRPVVGVFKMKDQ